MSRAPLLEISNLAVEFRSPEGGVRIVDDVSLTVGEGETLGIVGESGCGKSILSLSVLRLLPAGARIAQGDIRLEGRSLSALPDAELRSVRGNAVSMIFQEPMTALNPVFTVGNQLAEVFRVHQGLDGAAALERAVEILAAVGVPSPEARVRQYPHQLSGGMRQRVMIAMALACRPKLLIADEPTTALDVTIQAQILELMDRLQSDMGTAIIFISHDLGVIAEISDRVAVIYSGRIVEEAPVQALFENPRHPYTQGLMRAVPQPDADVMPESLYEIPGTVPNPTAPPTGCRFHPRCPVARDVCRQRSPSLETIGAGHRVACWEALDG